MNIPQREIKLPSSLYQCLYQCPVKFLFLVGGTIRKQKKKKEMSRVEANLEKIANPRLIDRSCRYIPELLSVVSYN